MKPIVIIVLAIGLVALVAIIGGNYYVQNQTNGFIGTNDVKPWFGLDCDEMIDFSGSDEHHSMHDSMHMEFHQYYSNHCSETEFVKP